jgi:hypothetical protein
MTDYGSLTHPLCGRYAALDDRLKSYKLKKAITTHSRSTWGREIPPNVFIVDLV